MGWAGSPPGQGQALAELCALYLLPRKPLPRPGTYVSCVLDQPPALHLKPKPPELLNLFLQSLVQESVILNRWFTKKIFFFNFRFIEI